MKITKLAKLAGISIRTLHYYDEIGLLSPTRCDTNNRREYTGNDFIQLHQILHLKNLGFSLAQIKNIMDSPDFDYQASLRNQIEELRVEKQVIDKKINKIEEILNFINNNKSPISDEQYSSLFNVEINPYRKEAERLWGTQIVEYSEALVDSIPEELKQDIANAMQTKLLELSNFIDLDVNSKRVQQAILQFHTFLNKTHGNLYTLENFSQLGKYYVESKEFNDSFEKIKPGFAQFMQEAIQAYVENKSK